MKKHIIIILLVFVCFTSCDPDVSGEEINLPQLNFGFKIIPDTAHIKLGDTLTISASISSTLENGVKITDGKAIINGNIVYTEEIPIETFSFKGERVDEFIDIYNIHGDIDIHSSGMVREFHAVPTEDSIMVVLKVTPKETGTFGIYLYSNFYEGSLGKTRTNPFFDVANNNFDVLWKIPGSDLGSGDYGYDNAYLFAVYE